MAIVGVLTVRFLLPVIAVFLWLMGRRELLAVRARALGANWPFGAFAAAAGRGPAERSPDSDGPAHDARAPQSEGPGGSGGGFSDEEIEQLERDRGHLRRDWRE